MKKFLVLLLVVGLVWSCSKDEESLGEAELLSFEVSPDCSCSDSFIETLLDVEYNLIHIFAKTELKSSNYPLSLTPEIEVSAGASIIPDASEQISFSSGDDFVEYEITSEDKNASSNWFAIVRDKQLPNSDFEVWHQTAGMEGDFSSPGAHESTTIWSTANLGTSTYGVYGTVPLEENGNTMVKIITGETVAVPVTAGTLFIGRFNLQGAIDNPTDPSKATDFGTPFIYRPKAIKFKMKYSSGEQLIEGTLKNPSNLFGGFEVKNLDGKDEYKVYGFLEQVSSSGITQLASMEILGSGTSNEMTEVTIPFVYTSEEYPNQISLVFTSSANGHLWRGAIGSTLIVDDISLIYE